MKECLRCHHSNDEQNNFCIKCGAPLKIYAQTDIAIIIKMMSF